MAEVQVENIVVSFAVSSSLDLLKLAEVIPDAQYHPEEAPALILQFSQPRSMAALSPTGTVVLTGPKTIGEVHDVVKMVMDHLSVAGIELIETPEISVQNVTASINLNQPLKLRNLAKSLRITEFSPRIFPGLIYKGDDPNTVILLFDSGKIVCNGKTLESVTVALEKMVETLLSFGIKKEEDVCQK
jgi:transcription initiation factor TFIID TATA-box-binding protein